MQRIILASQSPRRKQLLEWAEVPFDVLVKETDESYPENLSIEEIAIHIARNKALAVKTSKISGTGESLPVILAADTIVVLDNEIIGKPKDKEDAVEILSALSGRQHKVITGVVILNGEEERCFAETTEVEFHDLSPAQVEFYVNKYKPYDKAGAYAIQEWIGVVGIKSIQGDFYNVMGLPVSRVVKEIENLVINNG
jgi:septum formation protein